jgi:hypothetical protein
VVFNVAVVTNAKERGIAAEHIGSVLLLGLSIAFTA